MTVILSLLMAIAPSLFLVYYFNKQDRRKPEPTGLIIKMFLLGFVITIPVIILELVVSRFQFLFKWNDLLLYFFESFIVAAMCEEYMKYFVVRKFIYSDRHFDEVMDGIVYTVVASMGFACFENVFYVLNSSWGVAILRAFTAVPLHAVASGLMGYYLGLSKFAETMEKKKSLVRKGIFIAIIIHGVYDFFLIAQPVIGGIFTLLVFPLLFFSYRQLIKNMKLAKKSDIDTGRS
ncbi:PrsW family intramembrane metalloprotease [candidate division KSB1 bacterium]|nr:PrsW family intramembrane metalloprotease [candidate division KSB1 bacterium]